jgi:hypothetical protein
MMSYTLCFPPSRKKSRFRFDTQAKATRNYTQDNSIRTLLLSRNCLLIRRSPSLAPSLQPKAHHKFPLSLSLSASHPATRSASCFSTSTRRILVLRRVFLAVIHVSEYSELNAGSVRMRDMDMGRQREEGRGKDKKKRKRKPTSINSLAQLGEEVVRFWRCEDGRGACIIKDPLGCIRNNN